MSDTQTLEPFKAECNCDTPSCKQLFERYKVLYDQYVAAFEESKAAAAQNTLLGYDVKYTNGILEGRIKVLEKDLELERTAIKALLGDVVQDKSIMQDKTVCPSCIKHKDMVMAQRQFFSNNTDAGIVLFNENKKKVLQSKAEVIAEQVKNGKLRVEIQTLSSQNGVNKEIEALRIERDRVSRENAELQKTVAILKLEKEENRHRYISATEIVESLQIELRTARAAADVQKEKIPTVDQDDELKSKMRFEAAVNQYRQMVEGRGVKRDRACVEEDTCPSFEDNDH